MTRTTRTGMLFLTLALAGCRQVPVQPAEPTAQPTPRASANEPALLSPADPGRARMALSDRLALEADARPVSAVRPEQLERALRDQGVVFTRKRQVLASTVGAAYCELAVSSEGLGVSVCEFVDAATAARGSAQSHRLFDTRLPGRTLVTHHGTLLTLTEPQGRRARDQAALIVAVFNAASPTPLETKTTNVPTHTEGEQT